MASIDTRAIAAASALAAALAIGITGGALADHDSWDGDDSDDNHGYVTSSSGDAGGYDDGYGDDDGHDDDGYGTGAVTAPASSGSSEMPRTAAS